MEPYEKLKNLRIEKGLTTYELSEMTDIPQSTISKMENNKRKLDADSLAKLANALKVSISEFFDDSITATDNDIKHWDEKYKNLKEDTYEEDFDEETRAIARDMKNLSPNKKKLLKDLIKTMTEAGDEELNK